MIKNGLKWQLKKPLNLGQLMVCRLVYPEWLLVWIYGFVTFAKKMSIPYIACPPFEDQADTMDSQSVAHREICLQDAVEIKKIRNSSMINLSEGGIIVWDGNKGGTHNVLQQMLEKQKDFVWINPVAEKVWKCF